MADAIVINKIDSATADQVAETESSVRALNPAATIVRARSPVSLEDGTRLGGKRVLVIEDGPTLTHGEMAYGAGVVAARAGGAAEIVDPRPWAVGSIKETFARYPLTGAVLPAMGYSPQQVRELADTIRATPADVVVVATPIDLRRIVPIERPAVRVRYELEEVGSPTLVDILKPMLG
jgi:predicted GTPase